MAVVIVVVVVVVVVAVAVAVAVAVVAVAVVVVVVVVVVDGCQPRGTKKAGRKAFHRLVRKALFLTSFPWVWLFFL